MLLDLLGRGCQENSGVKVGNNLLIFADLHLKPETSDIIFNKVLPAVLKACQEHGIKHIICLGDIWEVRYKVPVIEQNLLDRWLSSCEEYNIHIDLLPGNHDAVDISGSNALEIFNSMNICVHTNPAITPAGGFIPYRKDISVFLQAVENMKNEGVKRLFIHQDIMGALMNQTRASETGVNPNIFDSFDIVLAGHYHIPSVIGKNTHYIGSMYATKRDEIENPHRYVILSENNHLQSIAVNFGHPFIELTVMPVKQQQTEARLQVSKDASLEEYALAYLSSKITNTAKLPQYKDIFTKVAGHAI